MVGRRIGGMSAQQLFEAILTRCTTRYIGGNGCEIPMNKWNGMISLIKKNFQTH